MIPIVLRRVQCIDVDDREDTLHLESTKEADIEEVRRQKLDQNVLNMESRQAA